MAAGKPSRAALVLGATGHLGQAIVRELLANGYRVSAATRQPSSPRLTGLDVRIMPGDADVPGQLDAWIAGHDVVVDAGAPSPLGLHLTHLLAARDPYGHAQRRTDALVEAVGRYNASLAFVSTFTTLPRRGTVVAALERQWRHAAHPYFGVKQLMEDSVLRAARDGLRAVVINPTACLGPWENTASRDGLVGLVLSERLPGAATDVVNVIDVRDVAFGARAALEAEYRAVRIPLAGHNVGAYDLACLVARLADVRAPVITTSARIAAIASACAESALAVVGRTTPATWAATALIADAWPMEHSAEQRALGVRIRPLEETLRDAIEWHRDGCVA